MVLIWKESDRFQIEPCTADSNHDRKYSINSISLSPDAHYLAIGYGTQLQIWDLVDNTAVTPKANVEVNTTTNFAIWFSNSPRLVTAHDEGPVYVFTIKNPGVDIAYHRDIGVEKPATSIAILDERTIAVALTEFVQIQWLDEDPEESGRWKTIAQISPSLNEGTSVRSVHTITQNRVLVSCSDEQAIIWQITRDSVGSVEPQVLNVFLLPGLIVDSIGNQILCTDHASRTYKSFKIGAGGVEPQATLSPRTRDVYKTPQPASTATFLPPYGNAIIGGGVGQLILFDDQGNRLQNLSFKDESEQCSMVEQANRACVAPQSISQSTLTTEAK
ncbi:hypothetical protein F5879DRAFT_925142 [Lentinula edodes]|uniref:uncharacterized protein n=1 Tax=Lentinula edodes TaxID=5353 RepID=UPI001E8E047F|nr:uncharacterized protein C8R40DRAFT_1073734 [Lentinula edodes]KAH7869939.1 hypothetical protein C8R40DRAFT_1073734 [Lentinula edodes]KAJ3900813.1 hypothetical protein F5879DRAFT_925142 [Lentinula edodes]